MPTGWRYSSAWWNGSGAGPHSPAHPTHAALRPSMTDSMADTRPPGLRSQVLSPPSSITRSTGRRFAATTRSNVGPATVTSHHHLLRGSLSSLRRLEQPRSGNEEVPRILQCVACPPLTLHQDFDIAVAEDVAPPRVTRHTRFGLFPKPWRRSMLEIAEIAPPAREDVMKAQVGDRIILAGIRVDDPVLSLIHI